MKKDQKYVEQWMRNNNMFPETKIPGADGEIVLADSRSAFVHEGKWVYRTGYCIQRGETRIAATCDYSMDHDSNLTPEGKRSLRLSDAISEATVRMQQLRQVGYHDAPRTVITPPKSMAEKKAEADAMVARILEASGHAG